MTPYQERAIERIIDIFKDEYCTNEVVNISWREIHDKIIVAIINEHMTPVILEYPVSIAQDPAPEILFNLQQDFEHAILQRFIIESQL